MEDEKVTRRRGNAETQRSRAATKVKSRNEPALAGGILLAPGVSPGIRQQSQPLAREAGDRNCVASHM